MREEREREERGKKKGGWPRVGVMRSRGREEEEKKMGEKENEGRKEKVGEAKGLSIGDWWREK